NFRLLHSLNRATEGSYLQFGVTEGADGYFYGTTDRQGPSGFGTIFRTDSAGRLIVLHAFDLIEGQPEGRLVQGPDGNFYGTTSFGSPGETVFRSTPSGAITFLHYFNPSTDGHPLGGLVLASDGYFYGTTTRGIIYKIDVTGNFAVVHTLAPDIEGSSPRGELIQATDGNFYGTTPTGGQ